MSLEKIKELRVKAESAKALLALADDENERILTLFLIKINIFCPFF